MATAKINVKGGYTAIVDKEDYNRLAGYDWFVVNGRPARRNIVQGKNTTIFMSRDVHRIKVGDPRTVRYIDKDVFNNQKSNLKIWKGNKSRAITVSSKGLVWPNNPDEFKVFIENTKELGHFNVSKLDILDLIDTASYINWKHRQIKLIYELGSMEYTVAQKLKPYLIDILKYFWDWNGRLHLLGYSERYIKEYMAKEETRKDRKTKNTNEKEMKTKAKSKAVTVNELGYPINVPSDIKHIKERVLILENNLLANKYNASLKAKAEQTYTYYSSVLRRLLRKEGKPEQERKYPSKHKTTIVNTKSGNDIVTSGTVDKDSAVKNKVVLSDLSSIKLEYLIAEIKRRADCKIIY